jgi:hypothetical protein
MADYPRITGTIRPTPRNRVSGFLADLLELGAKGYDVGSTLQAGGPITEGKLSTPVSDLLGIPELQRTLNRVSYNEPLTTGTGYTTRLRPDTLSAAMTAAPMAGPTAKAGAAGARITGTALKDLATSDVAYNAAMNAMRRSGGLAELTAYHGTPHRFAATERNPLGEFRSSQIGTGEGAQSYGHGLYLAEHPEVAKGYRMATSKDRFITNQGFFDPSELEHLNVRVVTRRGDLDKAIQEAEKYAAPDSDYPETAAKAARDLERLKALKASGGMRKNEGSFYHVDLPDPMIEKMLHWDKPLSQQPKAVQQSLAKFDRDLYHPSGEEYDANELGQQVFERLRSKFGPVKAEAFMQSQGIPGIQYFDEGSRGASKGTRNFVVFPGEEKNLNILKRE